MEGGGQFWGVLLVMWLLGAPFVGGLLTTDWRAARTTRYAGDGHRDRYADRDAYPAREPAAPGPANQRPIA